MFSLWALEPSSVQRGGLALALAGKITRHVSESKGLKSTGAWYPGVRECECRMRSCVL